MPRVSIRKLFIYFLAVASCLLLAINIQQRTVGMFSTGGGGFPSAPGGLTGGRVLSGPGPSGSGPRSSEEELAKPVEDQGLANQVDGKTDKKIRRRKALGGGDLDPSDLRVPEPAERPWYMQNGLMRPKPIEGDGADRKAEIYPEELPGHDRIPEQLMFMPPEGSFPEDQESADVKLKKILLWNGINSWGGLRPGRGVFIKERCPVSTCAISSNRMDSADADMVLFKDHFTMPTFNRPASQIWMLYLLECPLHTQMFKQQDVFNWTSTYRSDSTIVAPYERWQYYNDNVIAKEQPKDYSANKTKAVAWFVSNCGARNGRLDYAKELQKYIQVDIYGSCGSKRCPRSQADQCFKLLDRDYKFYLAFENSNCKDYITEKFFVNGLMNELVPIVMGARPEDYARSAPYKSYIHVDDFESPKELAEYLHKLDQDDNLYNEYFKWKGTGEFINTKFFCRVCSMLHDPKYEKYPSHIEDVNEWWRGQGTCINGSWRKFDKALQHDAEKQKGSEAGAQPPQAAPEVEKAEVPQEQQQQQQP